MKRKDIQRLAHQLAEGIDQMRTDLANAEAKISNQTAEIKRLRAAGDSLVAAIRNHDLREEHLKTWEDARRG